MEFLIVALPVVAVAFGIALDQRLDLGELVIGAHDARLPIEIRAHDRLAQRLALQQLPHLGDLPEILERNGKHGEALLPLDDDEAFGGEPRQRFAHRIDADVIGTAQRLELELGAGLQYAQYDVASQAVLQRLGEGCVHGRKAAGGVHFRNHSTSQETKRPTPALI